jgi:catechol 2,3-dioxygenase-like lactoylglutathione lyase family enzyme
MAGRISRTTITGAEPQLFVGDIAASCAFFKDALGFAVVFTYGTPPFYAQVARDAARINLRCLARPVMDPAVRDAEELLAASLTVATAADLEALAREFTKSGAPFFRTPRTQPWGARDFIIRDPDGNLLLFAGPAP